MLAIENGSAPSSQIRLRFPVKRACVEMLDKNATATVVLPEAGRRTSMRLVAACALLLLAAAGPGLGDSLTGCSESDVTALRDTLRQSACRLVPGQGNRTETEAFQEYVFTKHGAQTSKLVYIKPCIHALSVSSTEFF